METTNKMVKKFSSSFLTTLAILAGMGAAFATWTGGNTEFAASDFHNGQAITPNMIAGNLMGYVRDASGNNIYWRKFDTTSRMLSPAIEFCASKGMEIPSLDQITYYAINSSTYRGINTNGSIVNFNGMTNASSQHFSTSHQSNQGSSCSSSSCLYYRTGRADSWSSISGTWGYNAQQIFCVYKRWH